jgi:hypothetical protein
MVNRRAVPRITLSDRAHPSIAQLLAMKLAAWRDAIDRADAQLLLSKAEGPEPLRRRNLIALPDFLDVA